MGLGDRFWEFVRPASGRVSDLLFRVKGASRPEDYTLDPEKQIERGWLWPNGRVCHSA